MVEEKENGKIGWGTAIVVILLLSVVVNWGTKACSSDEPSYEPSTESDSPSYESPSNADTPDYEPSTESDSDRSDRVSNSICEGGGLVYDSDYSGCVEPGG